jgi:hypothetical protein
MPLGAGNVREAFQIDRFDSRKVPVNLMRKTKLLGKSSKLKRAMGSTDK